MGVIDDILNEVVSPSELSHYGVKGMKWGVSRSNTTTQDSSPGLPVSGGGGQDEYLWENEYTPGQELTEEQMAEAYQRGWDTILTRDGKFIVDKFDKTRAKKAPTAGFKKEALNKKQEPFKAAKPGSQKGSGIFNDNAKLGVRISKSKDGRREVTEVKHASVDGEVIKHHGVKGMKWGVRRTDEQLGNTDNGSGDGSGGGAGRGGSKVPTIVSDNPQMMGGGAGDDISEEEYQKLVDSLSDDEKADLNALLKSGMKIDLPGSIIKLRRGDFARQLSSKAAIEARNSPKGQIDALIRDTGKMLDKTKKDLDKKIEGLGKNIGDFVKKFKSSVENTTVFTTGTATRTKDTKTISLPQARNLPKNVKSVTGADGTKYRQTNESTQEVRVTTGWNILGGKTYVETKKKETYNGKTTKDTSQKYVVQHANSEGDTLEHHGVKGMRWGIRRATTRGGTPPSNRKPIKEITVTSDSTGKSSTVKVPKGIKNVQLKDGKYEFESKSKNKAQKFVNDIDTAAKENSKKTVKDLSDGELNERIRRLQAEKQYAQLTAPEKSKNVVADILTNSGKQIASQVITQVGTAYLKKAIGVQLDKRLPPAYAVGKVLNEVKKD